MNDNNPSQLSVAFRLASAKDLPAVERVFKAAFIDAPLKQVSETQMPSFSQDFATASEMGSNLALYVAVAGENLETVVGAALIMNMSSEMSQQYNRDIRHINLNVIAIDPAYQGKGIATRFLNRLDAALAPYFNSISLQVREDNLSARALYRRLGYQEQGKIPDMYWDGVAGIQYAKYLKAPPQTQRVA